MTGKRALPALLLALAVALSACAAPPQEADGALHVLCATYPVYLLTTAVTGDAEGVEVELLVNSQTSCLHDYTLTVDNMKAVERADVIVMNGAGLEDFLDHALSQSDAAVIDCSAGVDLLPPLEGEGHEGHGREEGYDPHIWMDPDNAVQMMGTIALSLDQLLYGTSRAEQGQFHTAFLSAKDSLVYAAQRWRERLAGLPRPCLVTFHDGFQYFARACGLELLAAIEEEEGATASAAEIKEIAALIEAYDLPAIFVEKNGSRATAEAIARETGCEIYELDMVMSGAGTGLQPYLDAMEGNVAAVLEALG